MSVYLASPRLGSSHVYDTCREWQYKSKVDCYTNADSSFSLNSTSMFCLQLVKNADPVSFIVRELTFVLTYNYAWFDSTRYLSNFKVSRQR